MYVKQFSYKFTLFLFYFYFCPLSWDLIGTSGILREKKVRGTKWIWRKDGEYKRFVVVIKENTSD